MDTWDDAQPDRDQPIGGEWMMRGPAEDAGPGAGSKAESAPEMARGTESESGRGSEAGARLSWDPEAGFRSGSDPEVLPVPDLRRALATIVDRYSAAPQADLLPKVMARAARIRRRRRVVRAASATAVLVVAALLGPSMASELGMRGGDASAAPPPSAIVDLTSAYPAPQAAQGADAVAAPTQPENALTWPSRGATVPTQAVDVAKSYLLDHVKSAAAVTATTTATVTTLWAQIDEDTTTPAPIGRTATPKAVPAQKAHKTWLYVMQGWTNGPDGSPSQAQLMVGDYTQTGTGKPSSMSVYATPVKFTHVRPGSADDANDAQQIAELSVFLPQSDRLVVLGAPQTETVLYAKTGGDLIPQETTDGVAVFPRTREQVKGHYADTIQVRDAKNVALTPPGAWSAGDFALSGAMSLWTSAGASWATVPPRAPKPTARPSTEPSAGPSTEPTTTTPRPKPTASASAAESATGALVREDPVNGSAPSSADPTAASGTARSAGLQSSP